MTFKARATIILTKSQKTRWVSRVFWGYLSVLLMVGCQIQPSQQNTPDSETALSSQESPTLLDVEQPLAPVVAEMPTEMPKEIALNEDLWSLLRSNFALDHEVHRRAVQQEIRWFEKNPKYWQRLESRMQNYLPYILEQVIAKEIPAELALLPIIESALDPYAFSPYGANGLWQFMSPTALQYGLQIGPGYDGRRDIIASTDAALTYLDRLNKRFDNWLLAIAAYNAGGGTVSKAVRRGGSKDFFNLSLPRETRAYVPRLLAMAAIVQNPAKYQVQLPNVVIRQDFFVIDLPGQFDIAKIVAISDVPSATIYRWNPALKRSQTPHKGPHRLILPYTALNASAADPDNQAAVAATPAMQASALQQQLNAVPENERLAWLNIEIRSGQTLSVLAQRYNTDVATLRQANGLKSNRLHVGDNLRVPLSQEAVVKQRSEHAITHAVRSGDSLWLIAKQYQVTIAELVKENEIGRRATLRIGQKISVPNAKVSLSVATVDEPPMIMRKIRYRVRNGDSLSRIANKFRVGVPSITTWNDIDPKKYLQPGQHLTLYIDTVGGR
ncbi:MAG: membrane-bound lytic murein transglycosylase D [Candidatus Azotimanducaceae bacterium]|jgi:membrane-bound lytic murein transglycosylase D